MRGVLRAAASTSGRGASVEGPEDRAPTRSYLSLMCVTFKQRPRLRVMAAVPSPLFRFLPLDTTIYSLTAIGLSSMPREPGGGVRFKKALLDSDVSESHINRLKVDTYQQPWYQRKGRNAYNYLVLLMDKIRFSVAYI
ncbi:hypothetical protein NDU88_006812 [Pleurodeles waltl]|uniref:Uncharacterized protein n=1 Tax=Pleurodeles waltl TaxID=8319 RepID=A0AAV7UQQ6_PLEWA|nr:hypothetical protein NDU88_006812 [Pleurodeles waltl]